LASHDSDLPLSKEAQEYDDLIRETHAAQEELAGRRTPGRRSGGRHWPRALSHWLSLVALGSVVLALFIGLIIFMALSDSEDESAAAGEQPGDAAAPAPDSETDAADSGGADGLAGTWTMYWTNSMDNESPAFTVVFKGANTGTLEILEDPTVSETSFVLEGDKVEFLFTRTMKTDIDDVLEESSFLGTLTEPDLIVGEWGRQDWECWPEPNAGCRTTPNWDWNRSRLVRQK